MPLDVDELEQSLRLLRDQLADRDRQLEYAMTELDKARIERDQSRRDWSELVDVLVGVERANTIVSQDAAMVQARKLRLEWEEMRVARDRARFELEQLQTSHRALSIARDENATRIAELRELKFGVEAVVRELKLRLSNSGLAGQALAFGESIELLERCYARDTSG